MPPKTIPFGQIPTEPPKTLPFGSISLETPVTPRQPAITDSGPASLPFIKQLTEMGIGIGTSIGKAGLGIGQTFLKGANVIGNTLGTGHNQYNPLIQSIEDIKNNIYSKPFEQELSSPSGAVGNFLGSAVPFVATDGATATAQGFTKGVAESVTKNLTKNLAESSVSKKVLGYFVDKTAQVLPEVASAAATQYIASGGDKESAKNMGLVAGVISAVTHVGSDAFIKVIPQTVKANLEGVFGATGKMGLKDASTGKKLDDAVGAMTTLNNLAPEIKVVDSAGIEKPFDPTKASITELPQALYQAKNKIYDAYTALATQAGDNGATFGQSDFNAIIDGLNKYSEAGYTPAYSNKAGQIIDALHRFGKVNPVDGSVYFKNTNPAEIQKLIESLNKDVNPLSDSAGAIVANDASNTIRKVLDDKISQATGEGYQALRNAYSQLKSIEPDIINLYKKALRNSATKGGFSSNFIDGIATVDTLQGILTGSPTETLRGSLIEGVKKAYQYLRDPEVKIQRAFRLLRGDTSEPVSNVSARLGFGNPDKNPAFASGKKAAQDISNIPNKQGGFVNLDGKATIGATLAGAGASAVGLAATARNTATYTAPKETPQATSKADPRIEDLKKQIAFRESGTSSKPYNAVNSSNKDGSKDYGKYQVNERTLQSYGKQFLGKEVTPQEFLASPKLQEKFIDVALKHMQSLGAKSDAAFLALWHKGWGNVSAKRVQELKNDPEVKKYIANKPKP